MGIGSGGIGQKATAGGVAPTPEQMALAQYDFGQGALEQMGKFGRSGLGHSTNVTQAIGGARAKEAEDIGKMSLANTAAMTNFLNTQTSGLTSGLGSLLGSVSGGGGGGGIG
jgi:hypothetical protein